ncbi:MULTISPECIES: heme exporter protein CcmD [Rhizobium/Agrobacterium group]|uniref:Heme exporter protein D n=1 Tax=Pararhizobium antarcticum TaxID=1798805 RepID=A0A657LXM6_9HYPH|nr:heme exporter protein CcmD [Rhizobium sp. 58]OJF99823.1 heme exporter protein CcmD [Pararhizobium antarcticum]
MSHTGYVMASYGTAALMVAGLILWVFADGRGRRRELKALDDAGIRRRSAPTTAGEPQ